MIEESSMTQNSDSFFWICRRSNKNEASRSLWFRLLPVLPLQNHRVFSAAHVLCAETSPLLCVCSERLPRDFQSSPGPARKEEHPVTSPVSAAQRNPVRVSIEQLQRNALCLLRLNTSSSVKIHSNRREDKCSWMLLLNKVYWIFAIQFILKCSLVIGAWQILNIYFHINDFWGKGIRNMESFTGSTLFWWACVNCKTATADFTSQCER